MQAFMFSCKALIKYSLVFDCFLRNITFNEQNVFNSKYYLIKGYKFYL
jgi:hypothetical protein